MSLLTEHCSSALVPPSMKTVPTMSFELWMLELHKEGERQGKLSAIEAIGETLRLFWERGVEPKVEAIINDGDNLL